MDPLYGVKYARVEDLKLPEPEGDFIQDIGEKIKAIVMSSPDKLDLYLTELKPEGRLGRTLTDVERNYVTDLLQRSLKQVYGKIPE